MDERCYNCRFFGDNGVMPETDFLEGECRRHAPVIMQRDSYRESKHPSVVGRHWCGDWQLKPEWIEARRQWLEIRRPPDSASSEHR